MDEAIDVEVEAVSLFLSFSASSIRRLAPELVSDCGRESIPQTYFVDLIMLMMKNPQDVGRFEYLLSLLICQSFELPMCIDRRGS